MDTDEGLFVPVLHDIGNRSMEDIKQGLEQLKADFRTRTIPPQVRHTMPLSLTFDHRAVTGGEASRFLRKAVVEDLHKAA